MPDWSVLIPDAPFDWEMIPLDGRKRPINPNTGELMSGWQSTPGYDIDGLTDFNGTVQAVGLKLGPPSGGVLAVDFDGPNHPAKFFEVYGKKPTELPRTVGVTSGKQLRGQRFFLIDQDWWDHLRGRKAWTDDNGETCLELRWVGHQSVIAGAHPETNGYSWLPSSSPADIDLAVAPDWLLTPLLQDQQDIEPYTPTSDDSKKALKMLAHIDPKKFCSYTDWLRVGMALHHTDAGLLSAWVEWSKQMDNFDEAECLQKWESFATGTGLTIRSLHHWAKAGGYKPMAIDDDLLPLAERISNRVEELLAAHLTNDASDIDAAFAELYKLGVSRDRAQERILMLWADQHGLDISTNVAVRNTVKGRVLGKSKEGKGLRQQLPGFVIDKDLHLLVSDAAAGKTTALCELVTVMTARDKGFLDHETPRNDPDTDQRSTALVIASDGEGSAYSMWEDYLTKHQWALIVAPTSRSGRRMTTRVKRRGMSSLHNLERLIKRLEDGDVCIVVMDTANAIFRGAGINVGTGPIETYLRLTETDRLPSLQPLDFTAHQPQQRHHDESHRWSSCLSGSSKRRSPH